MAFTFGPGPALDVSNTLVKNATGLLYEDVNATTPITDAVYAGMPVSSMTSDDNGVIAQFEHAAISKIYWVSGSITLALESTGGLEESAAASATAALAAQAAAEAAQAAAEDAAGEAQPIPTGGTTGQVLAKASTADRDVTWVDAGTGGGEGTVTAVGGVAPDESGNVPLTATSIGAAPATHDQDAATITTGTLAVDRIPSLSATKINSGTLDTARIPSLDAAKITSGTIAAARIPTNLTSYVAATQTAASEGDLLSVGTGKSVVPVSVEQATAGDIDYDGSTTVADRIAELLSRVTALETTGPSITNLSIPAISGTLEVGQTVTATNGTWDPTPDSYTYEWQRDGVAISGATASTYELVSADLGTNKVRVQVTAVKSGHTSGVAYSAPITVTADLAYVGVAGVFESAPTSADITLARDGSVQEGDYIVAILGSSHTSATSGFVAQSGSGTWADLGPAWPGGGATNRVRGIMGHVVGDLDSEPASYVFAHGSGAPTAKAAQLLVFRNVNPADPVNVAVTDYVGTSISNGRQTASLTVTEDNCIMLFVGWKVGSASSSLTLTSEPAGMTHVAQSVGGEFGVTTIDVVESYIQDVDSGATGTRDIAWTGTTNPIAQAIVLQGV